MVEALPDSRYVILSSLPPFYSGKGKAQPREKRLFLKKEAVGGLATEILTQSLLLTSRKDLGLQESKGD